MLLGGRAEAREKVQPRQQRAQCAAVHVMPTETGEPRAQGRSKATAGQSVLLGWFRNT